MGTRVLARRTTRSETARSRSGKPRRAFLNEGAHTLGTIGRRLEQHGQVGLETQRLLKGHIETMVNGLLGEPNGQRAPFRDHMGLPDGGSEQIIGLEDGADDAPRQSR